MSTKVGCQGIKTRVNDIPFTRRRLLNYKSTLCFVFTTIGKGVKFTNTYSQTLSHIRNKYKIKLRKQVETKMFCVKLEQKRKNYCSNICRYSFENKIKL